MADFSAIVRVMAAPAGPSESPATDAQRTVSIRGKQVRRVLFHAQILRVCKNFFMSEL
jgi:hypothetical protein